MQIHCIVIYKYQIRYLLIAKISPTELKLLERTLMLFLSVYHMDIPLNWGYFPWRCSLLHLAYNKTFIQTHQNMGVRFYIINGHVIRKNWWYITSQLFHRIWSYYRSYSLLESRPAFCYSQRPSYLVWWI